MEKAKPMVFVFGSNLSGIHGAGAARFALLYKGAVMGIGKGHVGDSYALPTKDLVIRTLPLDRVKAYVDQFLEYARLHPELEFEVTRVGCGLAGFMDSQIAPLFKGAPANCHLPTPTSNPACLVGWREMNGEA